MLKEQYEMEAVKNERSEDLMRLFEFGFTDFTVNEYLLDKHQNTDYVAEMLMTGQVSLEKINEIYAIAAQKK